METDRYGISCGCNGDDLAGDADVASSYGQVSSGEENLVEDLHLLAGAERTQEEPAGTVQWNKVVLSV